MAWSLCEVRVLVGDTVDLTDRPLGQALLPQREVWGHSPCGCCSPFLIFCSGSLMRGPKQQSTHPGTAASWATRQPFWLYKGECLWYFAVAAESYYTSKDKWAIFTLLGSILDFAAITNTAKLQLISSRERFVSWKARTRVLVRTLEDTGSRAASWAPSVKKQSRSQRLLPHNPVAVQRPHLLFCDFWGLLLQHGDLRGHEPQKMTLGEGKKGWEHKRQDIIYAHISLIAEGPLEEHTLTQQCAAFPPFHLSVSISNLLFNI